MRVLIAGSSGFEALTPSEEFRAACHDIGRALAEANCDLIVGSDNPITADLYVVQGFISVPGRRHITVLRPEASQIAFPEQRKATTGRIEFKDWSPAGPWEATFIPQIRAAEAVIIIGGAEGASAVGYVAPTFGRPVLAIPSFGGAAQDLWPYLKNFYERVPSLRDKLVFLNATWQPQNATIVVETLGELRRRGTFVDRKLFLPIALFIVTLILLASWSYLFFKAPTFGGVGFFVMLGISAFLGTALRNAILLVNNRSDDTSAVNIFSELSAGVLLAFALAIIYLLGGYSLTGDGTFIATSTKPENFQRVALSMSILGFCGGWLIESVSDRIQAWLRSHVTR